jgi:quercetin dioxygenase-like cupin family protein
MVEEARLEDVGTGLAPVTPGWFVVNAGAAAWVRNAGLASRCVFEGNDRVLEQRPDVERQRFAEVGITLTVLERGKPSGLYHAESAQEDFLVLSGECLLVIEEQERRLGAWDLVHCPAGTNHVLVGVADEPCIVLMLGARPEGRTIHYPASPRAQAHGAAVETPTDSPAEAYASLPRWGLERPPSWAQLPWA